MSMFAVLAPTPNPGLEPAIKDKFPDRYLKISDTQFLVSADRMTANQVSAKLDAPSGKIGRLLVIRFSLYAGWHSKNIWEWIQAQDNPAPPVADTTDPANE